MTVRDGLAEIPDNFDVEDWVDIYEGADDSCLTVAEQGGIAISEGKIRFLCAVNDHLNYDDPILYPGQQGAAHLHHFFGNDVVDYTSTYATLRTTGGGTCAGGPINRTAYWLPAMIKPASAGFPIPKVVRPAHAQLYYHDEPHNLEDYVSEAAAYDHYTTYGVRPFPNGLQLITGWEHLMPMPAPFGVWAWDHQDFAAAGNVSQGTLRDVYDYADAGNAGMASGGHTGNIIARLGSPDCWDGVNLRAASPVPPNASGQSAGRSHLAWTFQDGNGHAICPETHPYRIPSLTFIFQWDNNGPSDWKDWYLSVDRHNGHNLEGGHAFHTDWFGAWSPDIQTIWEEEHLALGTTYEDALVKTSVAGVLCRDNWALTTSVLRPDMLVLTEAERYLDIPAQPGKKRLRLNLTAA